MLWDYLHVMHSGFCTILTKLLDTNIIFLLKDQAKFELADVTLKARLQPFTILFSFSVIFVCFIDAQIHSCFREKMSGFERQ